MADDLKRYFDTYLNAEPVQDAAARVRGGPAARACDRQDRQEGAARPLRWPCSRGRLVGQSGRPCLSHETPTAPVFVDGKKVWDAGVI